MGFEEGRESLGILIMPLDAEPQRTQTAEEQPTVKGTERRAGDEGKTPDALDQVAPPDNGARCCIVMSANIFGRAVNDGIDAEFEWALIDRSGKGVVTDCQQTMRAGHGDDRAQIGDLHERIDGSLDIEEARLRTDRRRKGCRIGLIDEGNGDSPAGQVVTEERHGPGIVVALGHDVVPLGESAEHDGKDCRHSGAGDEGGLPSFERRQCRLDHLVVWVAIAGVELGRSGRDGNLRKFGGGCGAESGGLVDRGADRGGLIDLFGRVDGPRLHSALLL